MPDKKKKRIFGKFTINQLAAVDKPMQGDALNVIMKRQDIEEIEKILPKPKKGESMNDFVSRFMGNETAKNEFPDQDVRLGAAYSTYRSAKKSFDQIYKNYRLLSVVSGHTHMINDSDSNGYTSYTHVDGDEYSHDHPWVKNDDGSISIGEVNGHTHEVIVKSVTTGSPGGQEQEVSEMTHDVKKDTGELQVVEKKLEDTQAELKKAQALAEMNDVTKAFYKDLPDSEKAKFIAKSAEERAELIQRAKEDDPVVYKAKDGTEYRKSDDSRMVDLAKKADKALTIAKEATERAENEAFAKRAKDLSYLPGSKEVKVALLKAIDGIEDAELKKGASEILTAGNENLKKAFETLGTEGTGPHDETNPVNRLNALAKARADEKGISFEKAYTEVLESSEGKELYSQIETRTVKE